MRALLTGFFSTVGDVDCLDVVRAHLDRLTFPYDVAPYRAPIRDAIAGAIDLQELDPGRYSHLFVICGPCSPGLLESQGLDLARFAHCVRVGINLTMVEPVAKWNPFDILYERDSERGAFPDLTFLAPATRRGVAGMCVIEKQPEYGSRQRHSEAIRALAALARRNGLASIHVDTRWPASRNTGGLGSSDEVASVMARTDVVLTNRLHGMVYALKMGVPVVAIDSVAGGDKVSAQAAAIGWTQCFRVDDLDPEMLDQALAWCMSSEGRDAAVGVSERATALLMQGGGRLPGHEALTRTKAGPLPQTPAGPFEDRSGNPRTRRPSVLKRVTRIFRGRP